MKYLIKFADLLAIKYGASILLSQVFSFSQLNIIFLRTLIFKRLVSFMLQKGVPVKSLSLQKRQQIIVSELKKLPTTTSLNKSRPSSSHHILKSNHQDSLNSPLNPKLKKKPTLKRGRSLETEIHTHVPKSQKIIPWKTEKNKIKNPVLKKVGSKKIKEESFSRVSHVTSEPTLSFPSSNQLNQVQVDVIKLMDDNKELREREEKYKKIIEQQRGYIRKLQSIVEEWNA